MKAGTVFHIVGKLLLFLSVCFLLPIPFSMYFNDGQSAVFILSATITAIAGGILSWLFVPQGELGHRDGFAVVTFGWLALALFGALPYQLSHDICFLDCFFESMSGFTTTGSTIIDKVEVLAPSLLFWRSMTQWMGGMGIIVLSIAILPMLGVGGMQLFKAEVPGPTKDRLTPRIANTAKILWEIYALLTVAEMLLLIFGGMTFFDAICHSLTTMATGGFSTRTASIAYYDSVWVDGVITLFMFLAGVNFALHFHGLHGRVREYLKSEEFRVYLYIISFVTVLIMIINRVGGIYPGLFENFRYSIFQVIALQTTTGFCTADFDSWPQIARLTLVIIMFFGGCAGSTGGGMKVARILLLWKYLKLQMTQLVHPRAVQILKLQGQKVPAEVMQSILGFFFLYILIFIVASLAIAAEGLDLVTATSAVIATLNNIGPGLAKVGATCNFAHLSNLSKMILIFCMLVGRLELYTVVILLTPAYWKESKKPLFRWQHVDSEQNGKVN